MLDPIEIALFERLLGLALQYGPVVVNAIKELISAIGNERNGAPLIAIDDPTEHIKAIDAHVDALLNGTATVTPVIQ